MRYKVWVEIEELTDDGEPTNSDHHVLPDPLGEYDTFDEAVLRQLAVNDAYGSDRENSDASKYLTQKVKSS